MKCMVRANRRHRTICPRRHNHRSHAAVSHNGLVIVARLLRPFARYKQTPVFRLRLGSTDFFLYAGTLS